VAEEVGYYTLPVILSFDGVDKQVNKSLGGSLGAAGIKGGKAFGKGVADGVKASQSDVKAALDGYSKLYDRQADAAGKLKSELAKLQDLQTKGVSGGRLVAQSERVEKARRDETRAVKDATEAYKDFEQAQKSAANAGGGDVGGGFLDKLKGIGSKAKSAGSEAGAGFVDGVGGPVASLGSKGGAIGLALAAAAALGLGAGALLAKNISAGMDQLQDRANVQAKLGLDEASMKTLADAAAKSYAGNFGDSIAANMDAAGAALQSGLLDPKASQGATTEIINQLDTVSTVLGEDIPNVSRAASQAIRTGLVKDATGAFDLLTKASQNGLNVSDDLLDTVTEYGTQFRKLGLDGPTALGLVQQAVKAGARDTDVAADALKEFSIRAIDGSKTSATAYQAAGLDAQHYTEAIAAGGPAATEAFGEVLTAIRKVTDPAKQSAIAVGLFGTQSEDLGAALQSFDLSTAAQQFGNVDGAAKRASDTMGNTAVGAFESLKRTGEVALDSIQIGLANAFGPQLQEAANWVTGHVPEIIEWLGKIGSTALSVGGDVGQFVAGAIDVLAVLQEVTGRVVGVIANSLAGLFKGAGAVVGLFDDDMGKSITSAGDLLDKYGDVAFHSADTLHGFADMVRSGSTALDGFSTTVADAATQAADARRVTDAHFSGVDPQRQRHRDHRQFA
jgi:phage-related minor tail protein